jgi:HSP20 family protein
MANRYLTPWSGSRQWLGDPLFQLQREIDRAFDEAFGGGSGRSGGGGMTMSSPRIDMHEENGELCLRADLPGMQPQDLDVRVEGDVLTISGERKSEQNRNERDYHVMERSHGRFHRSIQLPFSPDPDEVRAEVRHGVLEIHIPQHAAQERSRRIEVRGESGQAGGGSAMTQAIGGSSGSSGSSGGGGASGSSSSSGERSRSDASSAAVSSGNVGQGPGGSSSSPPGTGSGAKGGQGGGMAGSGGGPTTAPAGESASSPSTSSGR